MKTNTTISLDTEVKVNGLKILKEEGVGLSFWVERCLRELIKKKSQKEVKE